MSDRQGTACQRRRAAGIAVALALAGSAGAHATHGDRPQLPPPGHAQVLVRLVWPRGEKDPIPSGRVPLEDVALHRAGAAPGEGWVTLPRARPEFSAQELEGGQVWVANFPVQAGDFDRLRLGSAEGSQVPLTLWLKPGQWVTVSVEVGFRPRRGEAPARLYLKRARILTTQ